jgi:hypothetical protein
MPLGDNATRFSAIFLMAGAGRFLYGLPESGTEYFVDAFRLGTFSSMQWDCCKYAVLVKLYPVGWVGFVGHQ